MYRSLNGRSGYRFGHIDGKWIYPPLERSRYSGGPVHFEEVSGKGTIYSYIVVRQALVPGRVPPYVSG